MNLAPSPPLPRRTVVSLAVLIVGLGVLAAVVWSMEGALATAGMSECLRGAEWHYRAVMLGEGDVEGHWAAAKALMELEEIGGDCAGWRT